MVLVVEVEPAAGDEDSVLRQAMFEVRDRLAELDVPIRRAWAGAGETAAAVSALHDEGD